MKKKKIEIPQPIHQTIYRTIEKDMFPWINNAIVTWGIIVSILVWGIFTEIQLNKIEERIYPDGNDQPLLTVCQADEKYGKNKQFTYDGMYFSEDAGKYILVDVEGTHKDEYKIVSEIYSYDVTSDDGHIYGRDFARDNKWIPKSEFVKLLTLEEVAKEIHEIKSGGK